MGFFDKILGKLGIKKKDAPAPATPAASKPSGFQTPASSTGSGRQPGARTDEVAAAKAASPAPISQVDVVKQLETLSAGKGLNWKVSIVDLLTLLELDSSREARNELATELGCPAELMSDSAKMNTWLHKEVLKRIAANGGNIPKELLD
ncbi:MAG TPA: DUF3597 domain-containing protein [Anaerolineales bacterium]|nr:DUF3597 domain-containing protein [Anaerolineales bacterium]